LSYFDPSYDHDTNFKGKYANLVFHLDTIVMKNGNDINQSYKDSFYKIELPAKIDYEKLSPNFARFTPPLCNYSRRPSTWDLQFSSTSHLGASMRKWDYQFWLGFVEPSFKEFLASPARMCFQVLRRFLIYPH
jgi:hypothetical protein